MLEIIERHPELVVWTVLILAVAACYLGRVLSSQWRAVRQAELEGVLKEQMIQRGMSAQEIVAVLQAGHAPVEILHENEVGSPSPRFSRPASMDRRWVWLALCAPLVPLVFLCGGFLFAVASVAVATDERGPIRVQEAPAHDHLRKTP